MPPLSRYAHTAHCTLVYELMNRAPRSDAPFVGESAFAHKGGLHASAVNRAAASYEVRHNDNI